MIAPTEPGCTSGTGTIRSVSRSWAHAFGHTEPTALHVSGVASPSARKARRSSDIAYREAATRSPSDAGRLEVSPPASAASTKCPGRWPDASGLSRSAIALTAQSADEAGDDLARGPCEMPGMPPGSATVVSAGAAGERTGIDCAGLPVRSSAGRRAERGAGGKGPVCQDGGFGRRAVTGRAVRCTIGIWNPVRAKPRRPGLAARPVRDQISRRHRVRRRAVPQSRRR